MSSKIEPKFYAVDAMDAYPEPVGTDDKLELNQEMGAVYVHLNYKRTKLVGLQSLDYLIKNLELIRVEALGPRVAAPVVERQPACGHEWTDDGQFMLICTKCGAQENHDPQWRDMATAPKDGTLVRLLVEFEDHSTEDETEAPTIGANNFDNDEQDEWLFAGWCWTHDHWTQGKGTPVGWLPMIDTAPPELAELQAELSAAKETLNRWHELNLQREENVAELQATIARLTAENERLKTVNSDLLLGGEIVDKMCEEVMGERDQLKAEIERLKGGQGDPVVWEYYSKPLRSWRKLENEADKSKAESMGCEVRAVSSVTTVAVDAAKAFAKGFNTLETLGGKYKIIMQFAGHDDAWVAYTALSQMTNRLDKAKELNQ